MGKPCRTSAEEQGWMLERRASPVFIRLFFAYDSAPGGGLCQDEGRGNFSYFTLRRPLPLLSTFFKAFSRPSGPSLTSTVSAGFRCRSCQRFSVMAMTGHSEHLCSSSSSNSSLVLWLSE